MLYTVSGELKIPEPIANLPKDEAAQAARAIVRMGPAVMHLVALEIMSNKHESKMDELSMVIRPETIVADEVAELSIPTESEIIDTAVQVYENSYKTGQLAVATTTAEERASLQFSHLLHAYERYETCDMAIMQVPNSLGVVGDLPLDCKSTSMTTIRHWMNRVNVKPRIYPLANAEHIGAVWRLMQPYFVVTNLATALTRASKR
jgi:hypothetical protein